MGKNMEKTIKTDAEHSVKSIRKKFKEQGVFYTDMELARKLKSYLPAGLDEVYDPTCGNGQLLSVFGNGVAKYGQEIDTEQADTCRRRLEGAHIATGDTLVAPAFADRRFKGIVSNYPFSLKYDPQAIDPFDPRFSWLPCTAPPSKADYMFIAHILHYLDDGGVAATLNFPGILYRGAREGRIRESIVRLNLVDRVVAVGGKHFVDTAIPTAIVVFRKGRAETSVVFEDMESGKSATVPFEEIKANGFNLSVTTYVDVAEQEAETDIRALNARIREMRERRERLEREIDEFVNNFDGL